MTENENPFLIPPPPRAEPVREEPVPEKPGESDPVAPLITLPPGLVDSATHRIGARVTKRPAPAEDGAPVRRTSDDIVFFPAPPGVAPDAAPRPPAPVDASPPGATSAAAPDAALRPPTPIDANPSSASDATVMRPRGSAASWRLTLAGGETVLLGALTFVGRNPAATPAWPGADLLAVADPTKSVSKTHALLEVDEAGLWVHDLDSTNGVWVVQPGSDATRARPRERVAVPPGADIELGEFTVQVEHSGH